MIRSRLRKLYQPVQVFLDLLRQQPNKRHMMAYDLSLGDRTRADKPSAASITTLYHGRNLAMGGELAGV